jgi:uncharacterized membrane protein YphA (DoxX/SURF4 family)
MVPALISSWSLPILRIGMGVFLVLWGVDKWVASEDSVGIFSYFYGLDVGQTLVRTAGGFEILLGLAIAVGIFPVVTAWIQLLVNAASTLATWKQILDPWGIFGLSEGGAHLFLASIVVMAVSIVLVVEAPRPPRGETTRAPV